MARELEVLKLKSIEQKIAPCEYNLGIVLERLKMVVLCYHIFIYSYDETNEILNGVDKSQLITVSETRYKPGSPRVYI
jgi:hypothetical protein